jgi:rubrerythrin
MEKLPGTMEEIVKKSIELEQGGLKYYTESSKKIQNSVGKRMLERLANDERNHIKRFKELYNAVANKTIDQVDLSEVPSVSFDDLFNRLKDQLDGAVDELGVSGVDDAEIIEMALDLENTTRFFYKEASEKSDDPNIKKLYALLAEEEDAHYNVLRKALDFLEDPSLYFGMAGKL